jgi:hypothetical protein
MADKVFWIIAVAIAAAIGLFFKGYDALIAALGLTLIALVLLKLSVDGSRGIARDIKSELTGRLSSLDIMVQDLTKSFKDQTDVKEFTLGALERTKTEMRTEFNDNLDKMAKKSIDIENGVNQMKRTFSAAFASLDDRLRAIEPRMNAPTGDKLAPEISMQNADEGYAEITPEGQLAE